MSLDIAKALSDRKLAEFVADVGAVAVLIGVIFESVAQFETLSRLGAGALSLVGRPLARGRQKKLGKLGAFLLIAGLAVEFLGTTSSHDLTALIEAQLSEDARTAELETAKLRAAIKWRDWTDEQKRVVADFVRGKIQSARIETVPSDTEANVFAESIADALREGGVDVTFQSIPMAPLLFGVQIFPSLSDSAQVFALALEEIGMTHPADFFLRGNDEAHTDGLFIHVGSKPRPLTPEAQKQLDDAKARGELHVWRLPYWKGPHP